MNNPSLLDSFALLAWIQDEAGAQRVENLLYEAKDSEQLLLMSIINLGEVYYRCARLKDIAFARELVAQLALLPIRVVSCTDDLVWRAAEIKAQYSIAYADAFAVATALKEDASIVTGDPEFNQVAHLVEIEWLR